MADSINKIETKKKLKIALLSKDREDGPEKTLKLAQTIGGQGQISRFQILFRVESHILFYRQDP